MNIKPIERDVDLEESFCVMKELRPHLKDCATYLEQIKQQHTQGYQLLAAWNNDVIVGLVGYRLQDNLLYGHFIYVDDLVVTSSLQRSGLGERLLQAVREQAIALHCAHLVLDTGLHMALAQRFYFRQGLLAKGMHFVEPLSQ
tara:strand:- start:98663 stop:99091 length:429 start_codon:yes stop_codon:yes gene_type:complete